MLALWVAWVETQCGPGPYVGRSKGKTCNVKGGIPSSRRYLPTYLRAGTYVRVWWGSQGFEWFLCIFPSDGLVVLLVEKIFVHSPSKFVLFLRSSSCCSRRRRSWAGRTGDGYGNLLAKVLQAVTTGR